MTNNELDSIYSISLENEGPVYVIGKTKLQELIALARKGIWARDKAIFRRGLLPGQRMLC